VSLNGRHPEPSTPELYSELSPDTAASKDLCGRLLAAKDHDALIERAWTFVVISSTIFKESL